MAFDWNTAISGLSPDVLNKTNSIYGPNTTLGQKLQSGTLAFQNPDFVVAGGSGISGIAQYRPEFKDLNGLQLIKGAYNGTLNLSPQEFSFLSGDLQQEVNRAKYLQTNANDPLNSAYGEVYKILPDIGSPLTGQSIQDNYGLAKNSLAKGMTQAEYDAANQTTSTPAQVSIPPPTPYQAPAASSSSFTPMASTPLTASEQQKYNALLNAQKLNGSLNTSGQAALDAFNARLNPQTSAGAIPISGTPTRSQVVTQVAAQRGVPVAASAAPSIDPRKQAALDFQASRGVVTNYAANQASNQAAPGGSSGTATVNATPPVATAAASIPTNTTTITAPSTTSDSIFDTPAFQQALGLVQQGQAQRDAIAKKLQDQMAAQQNLQKSTFDKIYGPDSRLSSFFAPSIRTVEQQMGDVLGNLDSLQKDIDQSTQDVAITSGGRNRIDAKERGNLTTQLSQLTRAHDSLTAGYSQLKDLSDKEFNAVIADSQAAIDATKEQLANSGMTDAEQSLINAALQGQLQLDVQKAIADREQGLQTQKLSAEAAATQAKATADTKQKTNEAVDKILQNALDFVQKAGATPSAAFDKVAQDAHQMAAEGKSLGEIQAGVQAAISQNPQVKKYMDTLFQQEVKQATIKPSGSGSSGTKLTAAQQLVAVQNGIDPNKKTDELTPAEAKIITDAAKSAQNQLLGELIGGL